MDKPGQGKKGKGAAPPATHKKRTRKPRLSKSSSLEDLSEELHERVAHRVKQIPLLGPYVMDESSSNKKEPVPTRSHRKPLKSGKLSMADTQVIHHVVWLHKFVCMAVGQPATCTQSQFLYSSVAM